MQFEVSKTFPKLLPLKQSFNKYRPKAKTIFVFLHFMLIPNLLLILSSNLNGLILPEIIGELEKFNLLDIYKAQK
ncbi:hypothetical protein AN2V17_39070 [Vallitalea sp. AN17-2]|uniref:Uncharacterized protein n=1 Tax=Vallitalea maricola TaxID=3074433 RepID=A0ACB5UNW0_9FIRM|nr:hypothetical protein AN2V17_39070 [Vallitalea sp. AN17-2]